MISEELRATPVSLQPTGEDGEYSTARLWLPGGAEHKIGIGFNRSLATKVVTTAELFVPEALRGNGLATKLLKAGFAYAKDNEVSVSMSHISSPYALMARISIMGSDLITICDVDQQATPLGIDACTAIDELESGRCEEGFVVVSDLSQIDTTGWEPVLAK